MSSASEESATSAIRRLSLGGLAGIGEIEHGLFLRQETRLGVVAGGFDDPLVAGGAGGLGRAAALATAAAALACGLLVVLAMRPRLFL